MSWVWLFIAGIFEVVWAVAMKSSNHFTRLWPSVAVVVGMILSVWFLSLALKTLPLGTAYAVWTGIGVIGAVLVGILFFGDTVSIARLICVAMILIGIIGLKLTTGEAA